MNDKELMQKTYAAPLHEQLASVPENARLVIDDPDGMGTRFIPVGRLCREAAAALRERLAQPEQESMAWRNAALRVGEDLCSVNPFGYYDMTAQQWLDWALSVVTVHNPQPEQEP